MMEQNEYYKQLSAQLEQQLFDERMRTARRMGEIKDVLRHQALNADQWADFIKEFCRADDRNRLCWRELECYRATGGWLMEHPTVKKTFITNMK